MPALTIDIEARFAQFQDSLQRIERNTASSVGRMQGAVAGLGRAFASLGVGLSLGGLVLGIRSTANALDDLSKSAQAVGVSVEALSALRFAGSLSGASVEEINTALVRLSTKLQDAAGGSKEAEATFKALGIAVSDGAGGIRLTEEVLGDIAEEFAKYRDGAEKSAIAVDLFGRAGARLIPLLNNGRAGLAELRAEAERLGLVIDTETAKAAERFNDELERLGMSIDALKVRSFSPLISALADIAEGFRKGREANLGFIDSLNVTPFSGGYSFLLETTQKRLDQLRKDREELANPNVVDLGERFFGAGRTRAQAIDEEIAKAERLLALQRQGQANDALRLSGEDARDRLARRGAGDTRPRAPIVRTPGAGGRGSTDSATRSFEDQQARVQQAVAAAINSSDVVRAREFALEIQELDRLFFDLGLEVEVYDSALKKLTKTQSTAMSDAEAKKYRDALAAIREELQSMAGDEAAAAVARAKRQNEGLRADAEKRGDVTAVADVDRLTEMVGLQARFNELRDRGALVQQQLATSEERIRNSQATGAISEFEAMQRIGVVRTEAVGQLEKIAGAQAKIATEMGNPKLIADAEAFRAALERLASEADVVGDRVRKIAEDSFGKFFEDVLNGTKSIKDAFKSMGGAIFREVNSIIAKDLGSQLARSLGVTGSGSGGGFGAFLFSLFGIGGSARVLPGGVGAQPYAAGGVMTPRGDMPLHRYATGGVARSPQLAMFGEGRMPEAYVPLPDGRRIPVAMQGGGGMAININVSGVRDGGDLRRSSSQVAAAAALAVSRGRRNL